MQKIRVRLKERSYDILIGRGLLGSLGPTLKRVVPEKDAIVITNPTLFGLYKKRLKDQLSGNGFSCRFEIVPDSEKAKSLSVAGKALSNIAAYDNRKTPFIIAFGGGVTGDLAGFIAAVYKRGIPYVQIPTTLLSQIDSAIGGKVAVDLPVAKNMVGAFYQPRIVISDILLLGSLGRRQIINGLSEMIKYGVIADPALFGFLENNYQEILAHDPSSLQYSISRCSSIKAGIISRDEYDRKGLRVSLNFGHTIGHAVESASGYGAAYAHGEAVAIGMAVATRISLRLGMIKAGTADRIISIIAKVGLPTKIKGLRYEDVYRSHLHDKKFINRRNRFVLPSGIGKMKVVEGIPERIVRDALRRHTLS